jgi:hypothetical protein
VHRLPRLAEYRQPHVVEFYDTRFKIGLTDRKKADLVAFLRAL